MLEKLFKLKENGTDAKTELIAGLTTFMAMAYIIVVNPGILSESGMPFGSVLVATCLGAAIGCFLMAALANYPFALAPSMGLNAYFTYSVCLTMGVSWKIALTAVFVEGIIFILLTLSNIRQMVVNSLPNTLKIGISAGIGLFIAFIGCRGAGIVVDNPATLVGLGVFKGNIPLMLALAGLILMVVLQHKGVKGSILIGIVAVTLLGIPFGVTKLPKEIVAMPPSLSPTFWQMDFSMLKKMEFWVIVFAFFFVDFFDTVGTLVGCASRVDMLDEKGHLPKAGPALMADAVGTVCGAVLGTSTVTTFVESAAGVEQGGRTGLTAVTVGILFLLATFLNPIVSMVPGCATAPALIMVGIFMVMGLERMDFSDWTDFVPAILAMVMMPFAYSISTGIEFGICSFVFLKLFTGKAKEISWIMYVLTALFIINHML